MLPLLACVQDSVSDGFAEYYYVVVVDEDGKIVSHKQSKSWSYLGSAEPDTWSQTITGLEDGRTYTARIYATSYGGVLSDALIIELATPTASKGAYER